MLGAAARPRARRGITGRALLLIGVVVLLVVVLAAPLHRYVSARSAVSQAEQQRRQNQQKLAELQQQAARWQDPAYVEQQARARLQYAMPGDTVYVVVDPHTRTGIAGTTQGDSGATRVPGQTWNQRLWGTLQAADDAP